MRRALLLAAGLSAFLASSDVFATSPSCNLSGEHLMSWPTGAPVWEFCWLRAVDSSGANGSGLEIRNVYYHGHLVLKRGHIPILNVDYDAGGCGCYRDWLFQEERFQADNVIFPGYAEPTTPPLTVCDTGGSGGDIGTFSGVAAEKLADKLILTTQMQAGWYRYTMKWRFHLDGRIEPIIEFAAVNSSCIAYTHRHHAYWRFDFDVDTPGNAVVTESSRPVIMPNTGGTGTPPLPLPTETMRLNTAGGLIWSISDSATGRGYDIIPGREVLLPADSFSVGDAWFLKYNAAELDDTGQAGTGCPINIDGFVNGESVGTDVVMWYRTGVNHEGNMLDHCGIVGPTLVPAGDWSP